MHLYPMQVIPQTTPADVMRAFFQSTMHTPRHPADPRFNPIPFTAREAEHAESESERLRLVDAGLYEEEPEQGDTWPVDLPEPVAESDLAWAADLSEFDRFA